MSIKLLNLSMGSGGFIKWVSRTRESDFIVFHDGEVKRIDRAYASNERVDGSIECYLVRRDDGSIGFEAGPDVKAALRWRDKEGNLFIEGDISLFDMDYSEDEWEVLAKYSYENRKSLLKSALEVFPK
jgi:hypothetical protein